MAGKSPKQSAEVKIAQHVSKMLDEYTGQKISRAGSSRPALEMRIANMINLYVREERARCLDYAQLATQMMMSRIMDSPPSHGFTFEVKEKTPGDVLNGAGDILIIDPDGKHGRCVRGIVAVNSEQARAAEKFRWKEVSRSGDLVNIERK